MTTLSIRLPESIHHNAKIYAERASRRPVPCA